MSDSVRPHRRQPTRLPRPRDSPGKNTGMGCHFPLQCMKVKVKIKNKQRLRCAYETARTSMDHLAELLYYRKEKIKNKYVYIPVERE